ncbi:hypothetical protein [Chitinophaga sp. MM2321]|uniref:hypothetical protein n=1 Tax=Chitinophaga sp. MM2321 TaxID=3137178 RepID=UPI0032D58FB0
MKSLILFLFLLVAGAIPYAAAQVQPQPANNTVKEGQDIRKTMFPDLQRDISNLQAREIKPKPDQSIISAPVENRLFTNYRPPVSRTNANARSVKPAAAATSPSDISVKEAMEKLKTAQAAHPVKPVAIPAQGDEVNNVPAKKKN